MGNICYSAKIISPRGNVIKEEVFRTKSEAENFKMEIKHNSDKRVRITKTQC